ARNHGMAWHYLPVQSGNVTDDDADQFSPLLEKAEGPILAFCRSGMRCSVLWALSRAATHDADDLLATAGRAGYDLTPLRPRLVQRRRD
ncbi:TIGR01244 family protein, partial [Tamilnaduibacter salinus]